MLELSIKKHGCVNFPLTDNFVSLLFAGNGVMDIKMLPGLKPHAAKNNFAIFPIKPEINNLKLSHCEPFDYVKTVANMQFS
jgi:hypothetical protein